MKAMTITLIAAAAFGVALPAAAQVDQRGYDNRPGYEDQRGYENRPGYDDRRGYDDQRGYDRDRHDRDDWRSSDWGRRGYAGFSDEYQRVSRLIDRGLRTGAYDRRQARLYRQTADEIRTRARIQRDRGTFNPRETQMLLDRLIDRMRIAYQRGRAQDDRYGDREYRR